MSKAEELLMRLIQESAYPHPASVNAPLFAEILQDVRRLAAENAQLRAAIEAALPDVPTVPEKMVTPYITQEHFDRAFPAAPAPAQAEQPKSLCESCKESPTCTRSLGGVVTVCNAHKAQAEQPRNEPVQQEPVAQWQKRHPLRTEGRWENTNEPDAKWWRDNSQGWEIRALYASQQARPMSEIDCMDLLRPFFETTPRWPSGALEIARAVERLHKIGG
jgi:uncharacterized membrane protein YccC